MNTEFNLGTLLLDPGDQLYFNHMQAAFEKVCRFMQLEADNEMRLECFEIDNVKHLGWKQQASSKSQKWFIIGHVFTLDIQTIEFSKVKEIKVYTFEDSHEIRLGTFCVEVDPVLKKLLIKK